MPVKTASVLAETERGREICAGNPQHTLPVASSGSISPQKCRDMRGRPLIYAFYGIIRAHISYGITGDRQSGEQMWCSRSFTPPAAAFRMTKISCVQDDKSSGIQNDKRVAVQDNRRQASSMVTRNVFLSTSRCHSEQSEESGEEGRDNGPRTSQIRILLKYRLLQKSIVRGPHFFWGTTNKVVLHCIVPQWITKS